jgi:vacuolar-type H+-ATPase subunit E/Vma4
VKTVVKTYFVSRFNETKKIPTKYDKTTEDLLKKFEDGVIHESKNLGISFLGDIIKIIMGLDPSDELVNDDVDVDDNGIHEFWEQVKAAVKNFFVSRINEFKKMGPKYKTEVIKDLKLIGDGLWKNGRGLAIDFLGDLIKVIMGLDPTLVNDEEMDLMNVDSKIGDWFKELGRKIKAFFDKLGHQIKDFFDNLGKKIKETWEKIFSKERREKIIAALKKAWATIWKHLEATFNKYKDMIIGALIKDGTVILEEAQKLLASVVEGLAKMIIDIIKKLVEQSYLLNDDVDADNGIKEFWEIVKAVVKDYFVSRANEFKKFKKYGPEFEKLLTMFEKDLEKEGKGIAVDFLKDMIHLIIDGDIPDLAQFILNDEETEVSGVDSKISDWFKKAWAKVKAFFDKLGHQIKDFFDNLGKKIKEAWEKIFNKETRDKIVAALRKAWKVVYTKLEETFNKYKDLIIGALIKDGTVILEEAEKLLQAVVEGIFKPIIDWIKKLIGKGQMFNDEPLESIAECVKAEKECMKASSGLQKIKCLIDLATCVGGETAKCAQQCGPPLVSCVKSAIFGGKITDVPQCFKAFITCASNCSQSAELNDLDESMVDAAIEEFHHSFPHVNSIVECVKAEKECMKASSGLQKFKCLVDLATCVGGETAKCAKQCGPPVIACVKTAIFDGKITDVPKCFQTFIKCAADCAKSG